MSEVNLKLTLRRFMNFIGMLAVFLIALSLILQLILKQVGVETNIINIFRLLGEILAYIITLLVAFNYVRTKRNPVWMILYAISATLIVVLLILR